MKCDRCVNEAIDIFPGGYDDEGNPVDEEALCELCIFDDWEEEMLEVLEDAFEVLQG